MADTKDSSSEKNEIEHFAPNKKSSWLAEVEADATYITEKRFAEYYEEKKREEDKKARADKKS